MINIDYFILNTDENIKSAINLNIENVKMLSENEDIVMSEIINPETKMTDYIKANIMFKYYHIFSDKIKKVIEFYELDSIFYCVFIISKDMKKQFIYWKMDISKIDSILIKKIDNQKNFYIEKDSLNNKSMLLAEYEKQKYILFREDIAESILRRCPIGIKFKQAELC